MNETNKAQYFQAESAAANELAAWTAQFPPGAHQTMLGLLAYQTAIAVREGRGTLVKDLCVAQNSILKSQMQASLLLGELWSKTERATLHEHLSDALATILKRELPNSWEDILCEVAEEFERIETEITAVAKVEAPRRITLR